MMFAPAFLTAVSEASICTRYYAICADHPLRAASPKAKAPSKEVLQVAQGRVDLTRLPGPGTVFALQGLPPGTSLNFIIQGGSSVETDFTVSHLGQPQRGTLAILCHAATVASGLPAPNPPYPRPDFRSTEELVSVFVKLESVVRALATAGSADGR